MLSPYGEHILEVKVHRSREERYYLS